MKIYIAAMYQQIDVMKFERLAYTDAGFICTAEWIESDEANQARSRHENATIDLAGIDEADVLVLYTQPVGTKFSSGGRMVEFGYALGKNMPVFVVGERENVFCHLDHVVICKDTADAVRKLLIFQKQVSAPQMSLMVRMALAQAAFDESYKLMTARS
jgi:nucleoside 2-deoxyribosyltransferase